MVALKKLTLLGQVESGLSALVDGKRYAYTAILNETAGEAPYRLGVAVLDEPGYYPVPIYWAWADEYEVMSDHARELNRELGLSDEDAGHIVATSIGAQHRGERTRRGNR